MSEILEEGPTTFKVKLRCHKCKTKFVATEEDLGIDGFKADPNTYWFDGSATSVDKFYAWCPHKCDLIFIKDKDIPELAKRKAIRGR